MTLLTKKPSESASKSKKNIKPLAGKLSNENFTSRAKPEVVEQSRQKLKELTDQLAAIEKLLAELG